MKTETITETISVILVFMGGFLSAIQLTGLVDQNPGYNHTWWKFGLSILIALAGAFFILDNGMKGEVVMTKREYTSEVVITEKEYTGEVTLHCGAYKCPCGNEIYDLIDVCDECGKKIIWRI